MRRVLTPAGVFTLVGLAGAMLIGAGTPPFEVADEPAHFLRAFQISEGQFRPVAEADGVGGYLPVALQKLIEVTSAGIPGHPGQRLDERNLAAARSIPLRPQQRTFLDFRNSAQLHFVPYLPQAAAIAVLRALDDRPIVLLYGARIANLLAATLLILWALRRGEVLGWTLTLLALTPIALQLRASASADALTTALGLAFAAAVTEALLAEGRLTWQSAAVIAVLAVLLVLAKPVYAPLVFALVAVPGARFASRAHRAALLAALAALTIAAGVLAMQASLRVRIPFRPDLAGDRAARIAELEAHPLEFLGIAARSWVRAAPRVAMQAVGGNLGWLDTRLPGGLVWVLWLLLPAVAVLDPGVRPLGPGARAALGLAAAGAMVALAAAQWVNWTPPGAPLVQGLQGRYLHPILPFLLAPLARTAAARRASQRCSAALPGLVGLTALVGIGLALSAIFQRYYGA